MVKNTKGGKKSKNLARKNIGIDRTLKYEDLIKNPKTQLDRIHEFLELPPFEYDFNNIDGSKVLKDDENFFNVDGFHDIKPVLAKQKDVNSKDILKHIISVIPEVIDK